MKRTTISMPIVDPRNRGCAMTDLTKLVKPLVWVTHQSKEEGGRSHYGTGVAGHWYNVSRVKNGEWHTVHHPAGKPTFLAIQPSLETAQAAADADHAARVIAALDGELLGELVGALGDEIRALTPPADLTQEKPHE
jgi:hypothetical protein